MGGTKPSLKFNWESRKYIVCDIQDSGKFLFVSLMVPNRQQKKVA